MATGTNELVILRDAAITVSAIQASWLLDGSSTTLPSLGSCWMLEVRTLRSSLHWKGLRSKTLSARKSQACT